MRYVIVYLLFALTSSPTWGFTLDRSLEFIKIYQQVRSQSGSKIERDLIRTFLPYKVLLIKGILNTGSIFFVEQNWFASHHIELEVVDTEPEGTVEQNIPILYRAITESQKPVIILSHSRGGVDTLATLLEHPELWRGVQNKFQPGRLIYWLAVHTPFRGSLSGELTEMSPFFRSSWESFLEERGGAPGSSKTFSIKGAQERLGEKTELLEELAHAQFPKILTFESWIFPETRYHWTRFSTIFWREYGKAVSDLCHLKWCSPPRFFNNIGRDIFDQPIDYNQIFSLLGTDISYKVIRSDGFVFRYSMELPGVPYVAYPGLDHWDLSSDDAQHRPALLNPADFLNSLFYLLINSDGGHQCGFPF